MHGFAQQLSWFGLSALPPLRRLHGLQNSAEACTSATIVNMTLSGSQNPRFLGLMLGRKHDMTSSA